MPEMHPLYTQSEEHIAAAEQAVREGRAEEARGYYLYAAQAQEALLRTYLADQPISRGVWALSAATLYTRAEAWAEAERICARAVKFRGLDVREQCGLGLLLRECLLRRGVEV